MKATWRIIVRISLVLVALGLICGLVGMLEVFGLHKRFLTTVSNEF